MHKTFIKTAGIALLLTSHCGISQLLAQHTYTMSGTIKDAKTGETLIGALVKVQELSGTAVASNEYGFFSLSMPAGSYTIHISYVGYQGSTQLIQLNKNLHFNIELQASTVLQETTISARAPSNDQITRTDMGLTKLVIKEIREVPVVLGEKDILKTIQLLPGVATNEGIDGGFYTRGGNIDQNHIILDEASVYNAAHLLGIFSTFNSDAIQEISIHKGTMPAQYGGRLSSVLDIRMHEGNKKHYAATGGIGLITSRLKLEGPIVKDKGSFMISGRRTYLDVLAKALSTYAKDADLDLYFYDLNAKANYKINNNNTFYLAAYKGHDVLGFHPTKTKNRLKVLIDWGNTTSTLRWNHLFSSRLFSNTSFIYSQFKYHFACREKSSSTTLDMLSAIRDYHLKQDFHYFPNTQHTLRFGSSLWYHSTTPGAFSAEVDAIGDSTFKWQNPVENRYSLETAGYIADEWAAIDQLRINYGIRVNVFTLVGPGTFHSYHPSSGYLMGYKTYKSRSFIKSYWRLEPRLSLSYSMNERNSVKASYNRTTQNVHLVPSVLFGTPGSDVWLMSSNNMLPETAYQLSLGYYKNLKENTFEFSAEWYYKHLGNQIALREQNVSIMKDKQLESVLIYGRGRTYGAELFLRKRYEATFSGWISYTLSTTERQFDVMNQGRYFPAKQDRRHDLSVVGIYKITKYMALSAAFVYATGNAISLPNSKYQIDRTSYPYYDEYNSYRAPAFHRLDFGLTLKGKLKKSYQSEWVFSIYNIYNRKNAMIVYPRYADKHQIEIVKWSLFGTIPAITWNFVFQ